MALWTILVLVPHPGHRRRILAGLIVGVIVMDLGVQASHVSNQTRIYPIDPTARSRLNMVYMVCYFSGGAAGSYLGAVAWRWFGWWGVCGFGVLTQIVCAFRAQAMYGGAIAVPRDERDPRTGMMPPCAAHIT